MSSELVSAAVVLVSALGGLIVGLGAPALASREERRSAARDWERSLADRVLELWEGESDLYGALTASASPLRRNLMLLGVRLRDKDAREACLELVRLADTSNPDEEELLNAWADMVAAVASVYRSPRRKAGGGD